MPARLLACAHPRLVDLGVADRVQARELQRAEESAHEQRRNDHDMRGLGAKQTARAQQRRREDPFDDEHAAKSEAVQDLRRERLHEHRAHRGHEREQTRLHRAQPEPELQHQRQQERRRADADPKQRAADDARAIGREPEQAEVEQRMARAARVQPRSAARPIKPSTSVAAATSTGTRCRPSVEKPNIASASPSPRARSRRQSSGGGGSRMSGMKRFASRIPSTPIGRLIKKIQRQWKYVVMKPPSGGPTTGPTSAGIVSHEQRLHELALRHRAQQHETADRHHHRAAHALHEPRRDERAERAARARSRSSRAETRAIADMNVVRAPKRSATQPLTGMNTASDSRYAVSASFSAIGSVARSRRDRGQRRREHGRVHVLDEQGASDDQREKPVESHRVGSRRELARSMR